MTEYRNYLFFATLRVIGPNVVFSNEVLPEQWRECSETFIPEIEGDLHITSMDNVWLGSTTVFLQGGRADEPVTDIGTFDTANDALDYADKLHRSMCQFVEEAARTCPVPCSTRLIYRGTPQGYDFEWGIVEKKR